MSSADKQASSWSVPLSQSKLWQEWYRGHGLAESGNLMRALCFASCIASELALIPSVSIALLSTHEHSACS